ncbi:transglycosylase SLT domain-containing protein [Aliikangiella coralliicola]|uniref:Lytic murein transglycosylase n=1 Tax=Aliikangiella coralliicola TaxID=2592383 RepID=A0A545U4W7_9GAMM|nr:transglycosylase SLT domain-containing protein [Aliikangiella coralliicola]TQV84520.1 hypothetical protein FLL46_23180 [Aliikangiella coralliicola]
MSSRQLIVQLIITQLVFCCLPVFANNDSLKSQRKLFLQAEQAIKDKNWSLFNRNYQQLADYPLQIYLERDKLQSNFSIENTEAIASFLNQHSNDAVARKLRYMWLNWLANNGYTSTFLHHYREFGSTPLKCKQLQFKLNTSEPRQDIYPQIEKIWLNGNSLPKACDTLIKRWQKSGGLTAQLIWKRLLLTVKNKRYQLADYLNRQLPANQQGAGKLLVKVAKQPKHLSKITFRVPLTAKAEDIIQIGLNKLAWRDPNHTIKTWKKLSQKYGFNLPLPKTRRAIALSLAIDKDPKAHAWLNSVTDHKDSTVSQWLLATALDNNDWHSISKYAQSFATHGDDFNKWKYWQGVAETQLGNLDKAKSLFSSIADRRSYYGFLAARQLNQQPQLQDSPVTVDPDALQQISRLPSAKRAKEFFELNRLTDARREWNQLVSQTPIDAQIKLAVIAHNWGWQHQAILAFARSRQINDVSKRFPLHLYQTYAAESKRNKIPVSWAYAITRQESAFKTDAISSAGARGLMQLKPSTAKQVAGKSKSYRRASQLLTADTNIQLGTAHLGQMYRSFEAHPVLATAAYNAGKSRVKEWLNQSKTQNAIQWIEQIPYKETREYVKNVLTYQTIYAHLEKEQATFISQIDSYPILSLNEIKSGAASR